MRKITLTFVTSLVIMFSLQAECTFHSFVVGQEFTIGNMLKWDTSEEIDNKEFVIEKSTDGSEFITIGNVEGAGSSDEENSYRFMDLDARKGASYYRLKQIDFDGEYNYSQTIIVNKSTDNDFMVASINNPLNSEHVNLTVDFIKDMELTYSIKDLVGDLLEENTMVVVAGLQDVDFDLSSYPNGVYKLTIESGEEVETITIRKTISQEDSKQPVARKN
jgi:hypothetical protein